MTIPVSVRGMHDVALVHLPDAGASSERCDDVGVGEDGGCIVDRRLIELDLGFELSDRGPLRVKLLLVDGVRLRQTRVTFEVEPGIGELRFVLRLLGHYLVVLRLVGGRIDLGEDEAFGHILAFGEGNRNELAVNLRAHQDGIEGLRGADAVEIDGHVGAPRIDRQHRHDIVCIAASAEAEASAAALLGLLLLRGR